METLEITQKGDNRVDMYLPITKVDKERRLVSGFATLDNVDKHGDIVGFEASQRAFERFRGNIREMHMPVAIGKMVSFEAREFTDPDTGTLYRGIYVTVKVSKGAQDTWEKVLDGTLSGFSIGGNILNRSVKINSDGTETRIIEEYELFELSLVDSPANPLANVFSIEKSNDGLIFKGMVVDYVDDEADEDDESRVNLLLDKLMDKFVSKVINLNNGGNHDMATKTENVEEVDTDEVAEDVVEKAADADATEEVDDSANDAVEKAAEVSEVDDTPALDVDKIVDDVVSKVLEALASKEEEAEEEVVEETAEKSVDSDAVAAMLKSLGDDITAGLDSLKESLGQVTARVESLENSTATKKSADVEGDEEDNEAKKSVWGGTFIKNSGYISTDEI